MAERTRHDHSQERDALFLVEDILVVKAVTNIKSNVTVPVHQQSMLFFSSTSFNDKHILRVCYMQY